MLPASVFQNAVEVKADFLMRSVFDIRKTRVIALSILAADSLAARRLPEESRGDEHMNITAPNQASLTELNRPVSVGMLWLQDSVRPPQRSSGIAISESFDDRPLRDRKAAGDFRKGKSRTAHFSGGSYICQRELGHALQAAHSAAIAHLVQPLIGRHVSPTLEVAH